MGIGSLGVLATLVMFIIKIGGWGLAATSWWVVVAPAIICILIPLFLFIIGVIMAVIISQ